MEYSHVMLSPAPERARSPPHRGSLARSLNASHGTHAERKRWEGKGATWDAGAGVLFPSQSVGDWGNDTNT